MTLALLLVLAVPAHAKTARFKAEIEGKQTTKWTLDHDDPFGVCGAHFVGNGNETFRFHTRKPLRLTVLTFAQARIFTIPDTRGFNARYRVTRHGSETITPHPGECAGGGGGSSTPPPAPDCGTRSGGMDLELRSPGGQNVQVTEGDVAPLGFKHCPVAGTAFPTIAISDSHGKFIQSKLPTRELLDRSLGKIIVLGRGIVRTTGGGTNATTRVSWTLTLTRIR